MEPLEGLFLRPRQVRYQAALRPDIHSITRGVWPLSDSIADQQREQGSLAHREWRRLVQHCADPS